MNQENNGSNQAVEQNTNTVQTPETSSTPGAVGFGQKTVKIIILLRIDHNQLINNIQFVA